MVTVGRLLFAGVIRRLGPLARSSTVGRVCPTLYGCGGDGPALLRRPVVGKRAWLSVLLILKGFFIAGTVGVLVSAVTEIYLLPTGSGPLGNALGFFGVGLIEELSKGAVLVAVAWRTRERTVRGGMVIGAIVGAGFAAFESAGYAFWATSSTPMTTPN